MGLEDDIVQRFRTDYSPAERAKLLQFEKDALGAAEKPTPAWLRFNDTLTESAFKITQVRGAIGAAAEIFQLTTMRLVAMAEHGDRVADVMDHLGGNVDAAREAVDGMASTFDLAQARNRSLAAGLDLTDAQFALVAKAAAAYSEVVGIELTQALDDVSNGIISGNQRLLKRLDLTFDLSDAEERYAKTINKTAAELSDEEKLEARRIGTLAAMEARYGGLTVKADTAGDSLAKLGAQWTDLTDRFAVAVTKSGAVIGALEALGTALGVVGAAAGPALEAVAAGLQTIFDPVGGVGKALDLFGGLGERLADGLSPVPAIVSKTVTDLSPLRAELEELGQQMAAVTGGGATVKGGGAGVGAAELATTKGRRFGEPASEATIAKRRSEAEKIRAAELAWQRETDDLMLGMAMAAALRKAAAVKAVSDAINEDRQDAARASADRLNALRQFEFDQEVAQYEGRRAALKEIDERGQDERIRATIIEKKKIAELDRAGAEISIRTQQMTVAAVGQTLQAVLTGEQTFAGAMKKLPVLFLNQLTSIALGKSVALIAYGLEQLSGFPTGVPNPALATAAFAAAAKWGAVGITAGVIGRVAAGALGGEGPGAGGKTKDSGGGRVGAPEAATGFGTTAGAPSTTYIFNISGVVAGNYGSLARTITDALASGGARTQRVGAHEVLVVK